MKSTFAASVALFFAVLFFHVNGLVAQGVTINPSPRDITAQPVYQLSNGPNVSSLLVMAFLLLSMMLMALAYMFAIAFGFDKLKPHIKSEFLEILASVLLLIFLWGIIAFFDLAASEVSKYVAVTVYGLSDPNIQKIEFNIDSGTAFDDVPTITKVLKSFISGLLIGIAKISHGAMAALGFTVSGKASILTNPSFDQDAAGYLVMRVDPANYRMFAEGILRKNIFCSYILWSYSRRTLVVLSIGRQASYESGGFDPSTGASLQIPIDIFRKIASPTINVAIFDYVLIHLLRHTAVLIDLLLPLGLILRAFPFFRPIGGFLLAVAITLYIFFPLGIVVFMGNSKSFANKCKLTEFPTFDVDPSKVVDFGLFSDINKYIQDNYEKIHNAVFRVLELSVSMWEETITSFLALFVAIFSFMRALSGIFGSDIAEIGRGLVKFV